MADSLAAVGSPIDDEDLIIHTLNGLPLVWAFQDFNPDPFKPNYIIGIACVAVMRRIKYRRFSTVPS